MTEQMYGCVIHYLCLWVERAGVMFEIDCFDLQKECTLTIISYQSVRAFVL